MKNISKLITLISLCLSSSLYSSTLVHGVGIDNFPDGPDKLATNYSTITSWDAALANGAGVASEAVNGTIDDINFTYTITVGNFQHPFGLFEDDGFLRIFRVDGTGTVVSQLFASNSGEPQGFFVVVENISDTNVVFDGFTQFGVSNAGTGEGATVNGNAYTRADASVEPAWVLSGSPEPTFFYTTIGVTSGRYVEFQFSTIPEPSSSVLFGIGAFALILRRSRATPVE